MATQNAFIKGYNSRKIATQLKNQNLSAGERDKLFIELEKSGKGYKGLLHHGDVEFDTARDDRGNSFDESILGFDGLYDVHIPYDTILPTGAIVVGGRKVTLEKDGNTGSSTEKSLFKFKKRVEPRANALIAYTHKPGASFSECLTTSANYFTQTQCTLTQCLGAKIIRHSEVNTGNFELEISDKYELAYVRFANAYYRAMRLLEIVERHKHDKLTSNEKMQLRCIRDSARIMYNRALYNFLDAYEILESVQRDKIKHDVARDSRTLDLNQHLNKWKEAISTMNATKSAYTSKGNPEK